MRPVLTVLETISRTVDNKKNTEEKKTFEKSERASNAHNRERDLFNSDDPSGKERHLYIPSIIRSVSLSSAFQA